MTSSPRAVPRGFARLGLPWAVATGAFFALAAWVWPFTMDDAFITFRYAKHIGDGRGPIWNILDPAQPVEGYTGFLQVWFLGLARLVTGVDVELAGKVLGIVCVAALVCVVALEARKRGLSTGASLVALSFACIPAVAVNAVSGMETGIFLLTNWLCIMAAARLLDAPDHAGAWRFVLFGLAGTLTRPESAAPFLLMAALVLWRQRAIRPVLLRALLVAYVLPGIAVTAWRYSFYHSLLPQPFYVKQQSGVNRLGAEYVLRFLGYSALPYLLVLAGGWRALRGPHRNLLLLIGLNLAFVCAYFATTIPLMGMWFRFLIPQVPPLAFGAAVLWNDRAGSGLRTGWLAAAAAVFALLCTAELPLAARLTWGNAAYEYRYREIGRRLRPFGAADRWMTFHDVGSMVYEAEWNTIDVVGLNTPRERIGSPCQMHTDLLLVTFDGRNHRNPCPAIYEELVDLPFRSSEGLSPRVVRVYARIGLTYGAELRSSLQDGWPPPYGREFGVFMRLTERLSNFAGPGA